MKIISHFWSYLDQFFLEWKMLQTNVVEKIKTSILCLVTFFPEKLPFNEIVWKNTVEQDRPHMTIWRMRFAWWITKATDTYSEYVILNTFPLEQWLQERTSLLRYSTWHVMLKLYPYIEDTVKFVIQVAWHRTLQLSRETSWI